MLSDERLMEFAAIGDMSLDECRARGLYDDESIAAMARELLAIRERAAATISPMRHRRLPPFKLLVDLRMRFKLPFTAETEWVWEAAIWWLMTGIPQEAPAGDPVQAMLRATEPEAPAPTLPVDPAADKLVEEWVAEQPQPGRQRLYSEEEVGSAANHGLDPYVRAEHITHEEALAITADVLRRLRGEGGAHPAGLVLLPGQREEARSALELLWLLMNGTDGDFLPEQWPWPEDFDRDFEAVRRAVIALGGFTDTGVEP